MKVSKKAPITKRCEVCGKLIEKKPEYTMRNWIKLRTCGRKCGGKLAQAGLSHTQK